MSKGANMKSSENGKEILGRNLVIKKNETNEAMKKVWGGISEGQDNKDKSEEENVIQRGVVSVKSEAFGNKGNSVALFIAFHQTSRTATQMYC